MLRPADSNVESAGAVAWQKQKALKYLAHIPLPEPAKKVALQVFPNPATILRLRIVRAACARRAAGAA
jgi:hypothetical protein